MTGEYVFIVEGGSDDRFIREIIIPVLDQRRNNTIMYSQEPDIEVDGLVDSFQKMNKRLYLLRDYDHGKQNCTSLSDRKEFVQGKFSSIDEDKIILVVDAIEAWYLSGLDDNAARELGITVPDSTEKIGKDEFEQKLENSEFNSSINFEKEIISRYSIGVAKSKNDSFGYMISKISTI